MHRALYMHDKADGYEQCECKHMCKLQHSPIHALTRNSVCNCFMTVKHLSNGLFSAGKIENISISFTLSRRQWELIMA